MSTLSQYAARGSYADSSDDVRITITADCPMPGGFVFQPSTLSYSTREAARMADIANRDGVLVLVTADAPARNKYNGLGPFVPPGSYQSSCKNIQLQIDANCKDGNGNLRPSQVRYDSTRAGNLSDISNQNGVLTLVARPVGNALDQAKVEWTSAVDYDQLDIDDSSLIGVTATGATTQIGEDAFYSTGSFVGGVVVTKTLLGPKFSVIGSEAVMRISSKGAIGNIDAVDVSVLEAHADADLEPLYAGAGVGFRLAGGSASIFDFDLGIGLSTGAGVKDNSVELKLAGTGVTVGQKVSISVFDTSFGLDLVRTAHAVGYVGQQLIVAVAIVPGAFKSAGVSLADEFKSMPGTFAKAGKDIGTEALKIPGAIVDAPGQMWDGVKASLKGWFK